MPGRDSDDRLVITLQPPGSVIAGAPFGVVVKAENSAGDVDTSFTEFVSLASESGSAPLSGQLSTKAENGVATFSEVIIDDAPTNNVLIAHSGNLSITSNVFNVLQGTGSRFVLTTSRPMASSPTNAHSLTSAHVNMIRERNATQLALAVQPPDTIAAGSSFSLSALAEDSFGNVDSSFNGVMTISDPAGSQVFGTMNAVNGVATFPDLSLNAAGVTSLLVRSEGLTSVASRFVNVTPLPATTLSVSAPLQNVLSEASFPVFATATDQYGNVDPTFSASVTIATGANPGSATLDGTLTVPAVRGVAFFPDLRLNKVGAGYTLRATSGGLEASTSPRFDVTADELVVTAQPPGYLPIGDCFGFTVTAKNREGNVDSLFVGTATASFTDFSFTKSHAHLGGELTVSAHNGIATFSGLTLNQAGNYQLTVASSGVGGTTTGPLNALTGLSSVKSSVRPLRAVEPPTFTVYWSGTDPSRSGIATYRVYVSDDGGPYSPLLIDTKTTSVAFHGQPGHTYTFYSLAKDDAGNIESTNGDAEALTTVVANGRREY